MFKIPRKGKKLFPICFLHSDGINFNFLQTFHRNATDLHLSTVRPFPPMPTADAKYLYSASQRITSS